MAREPKSLGKLRRLGWLSLGLMAGTGLVEAMLRIDEIHPLWRVLPVAQASFYAPDPDVGYTHRAGAAGFWTTENRAWVEINSDGVRDVERTDVPDTLRIGIIGDSRTEALQVDVSDTFTQRAERSIVNDGLPIEVWNLGLAGATPAVQAARLSTSIERFDLSAMVLLTNLADLHSPVFRDDSRFAGYVPDGNGWRLGTGFRDTAGYQFRTSRFGQVVYGVIEASRVGAILNERKNVGLSADLNPSAATPARPIVDVPPCNPEQVRRQLALWRDHAPAEVWGATVAWLDDLSRIGEEYNISIALAYSGLGPQCEGHEDERQQLQAAIAAESSELGLVVVDFDAALDNWLAANRDLALQHLTGFGLSLGRGHLNSVGHRAFAEVMEPIIVALAETAR